MATVDPGPENLPPGLVTYIAGGYDEAERALRRTLFAFFIGLVFAAIPSSLIGLVGVKGPLGHAIALVPAAVFVFFGAASWFPRFSQRLSIPRRVVYRGQVVKRWIQSDSQDNEAAVLRCCCVDDGLSEVAQTFSLKAKTYKRLSVGDTVQVTYSPRWQLLRRIRRIRRIT
jgi:hypothetical protein